MCFDSLVRGTPGQVGRLLVDCRLAAQACPRLLLRAVAVSSSEFVDSQGEATTIQPTVGQRHATTIGSLPPTSPTATTAIVARRSLVPFSVQSSSRPSTTGNEAQGQHTPRRRSTRHTGWLTGDTGTCNAGSLAREPFELSKKKKNFRPSHDSSHRHLDEEMADEGRHAEA